MRAWDTRQLQRALRSGGLVSGALLLHACGGGGSNSEAADTTGHATASYSASGTTNGTSTSEVTSTVAGSGTTTGGGTTTTSSESTVGTVGSTGVAGATTGIGGATSASTTGAPLGALTVSNLSIEPNPRMTLSAYVSWTTSEAANSEVQFGIDGYQFRIVDPSEVTEHRVHVVGMRAETAYAIKAVSTSQTATGSAEGSFTTGEVPAGLPAAGTLVADQREKMQPGWTLTNYHVGGSSNFSTSPAIIALLDEEGAVVWYFVHGDTADQFGMTSTEWLS